MTIMLLMIRLFLLIHICVHLVEKTFRAVTIVSGRAYREGEPKRCGGRLVEGLEMSLDRSGYLVQLGVGTRMEQDDEFISADPQCNRVFRQRG